MSYPNNLFKRAQENLEFPEILNELKDYAKSTVTKNFCLNLRVSSNLEQVRRWQKETADTVKVLRKVDAQVISAFPDIKEAVKKTEIEDFVLDLESLYKIKLFLEKLDAVVSIYPDEDSDLYIEDNSFYETINQLDPLKNLYKQFDKAIASETEVKDNASKTLRNIRRAIKQKEDSITGQLNNMLSKYESSLQDEVVTLRRGRFVIPVRSQEKKNVPGIVHDTSNTGQTLFIEPLEVVEANNDLRELEIEAEQEIYRILASLSESVAQNRYALLNDIRLMLKLDFMQAKANYAINTRAVLPKLNDEGFIDLIQARNPRIPAENVVPINISLGRDYRILVITGPNTGGKTVSLKTYGLLTLMAMSGLHIPAAENSEISIFNKIYTDIGDEQSIELDLSTFSAHIKSLVEITEEADAKSLVLVDEIGAGTDPSEGAALAIAVLDYLKTTKCVTLATTHFKEVKLYAVETEGVENASMEFDEESLEPTYNVLMGIPGTSHAFSIAQRVGLSSDIIENAKKRLSTEALDFERVLAEIDKTRQDISAKEAKLERLETELEEKDKKLEQKEAQLNKDKAELNSVSRKEKRRQLRQQSKTIDELISELEANSKNQNSLEDAKELRSYVRSELKDVESKIGAETLSKFHKDANTEADDTLREGSAAYAPALNMHGTITAIEDDTAQFKSGQVTIELPLSSLKKAHKTPSPQAPKTPQTKRAKTRARQSFSPEINIIGERVLDGLNRLDEYLDDAVLAGVSEVRIIHGKGTGRLRRGVREFLRKDPRVKSYEEAAPGSGDAGVTIAKLS